MFRHVDGDKFLVAGIYQVDYSAQDISVGLPGKEIIPRIFSVPGLEAL